MMNRPIMNRQNKQRRYIDQLVYRTRRWGLTNGQKKIIRALDAWFDEYPSGPTLRELAKLAGVSTSYVYLVIPVLEALGYITVNRSRRGRLVPRSIRLWIDLDDVLLAS